MKKWLSNVYRSFTCYEGSNEVDFDIGDDKVINNLFLSAASLPDLSAYANTRATTARVTAPTFGPRSPSPNTSWERSKFSAFSVQHKIDKVNIQVLLGLAQTRAGHP